MCTENFVPTHKVQNMVIEKVILGVPETVSDPLSGSGADSVFKRGGASFSQHPPEDLPYGKKEAARGNLENSKAGGYQIQIHIFSSKFSRKTMFFRIILLLK